MGPSGNFSFMLSIHNIHKIHGYKVHAIGERISSDKASNLPKRDVRFILLK